MVVEVAVVSALLLLLIGGCLVILFTGHPSERIPVSDLSVRCSAHDYVRDGPESSVQCHRKARVIQFAIDEQGNLFNPQAWCSYHASVKGSWPFPLHARRKMVSPSDVAMLKDRFKRYASVPS